MAGERRIMSIFIMENKTSICAAHTVWLGEGDVAGVCFNITKLLIISQSADKERCSLFFFFYYLYLLGEYNTYFASE